MDQSIKKVNSSSELDILDSFEPDSPWENILSEDIKITKEGK